jgi:hypothetical protein
VSWNRTPLFHFNREGVKPVTPSVFLSVSSVYLVY